MKTNPLSYEVEGRIIAIDPIQTFASGFSKREFIICVPDGKYPQDIKFEMHKERANVLQDLNKGDEVSVGFNLRGNEYNGKYYVNLVAWKVDRAWKGDRKSASQEQPRDAQPVAQEDDGKIPW